MCEPVTLMMAATAASAAVSGASAIMEHDSQRRAANTQADMVRENYAQADSAYQLQQTQVNSQTSQQMSQRAREAMVARGSLRAMLGGGNNAAGRILGEQDYLEATDMATLESNREDNVAQIQRDKAGALRGASQEMRTIRYPTLLGTGLKLVGAGLDAANIYNSFKGPKNKAGG
jgi:hypothetical protein